MLSESAIDNSGANIKKILNPVHNTDCHKKIWLFLGPCKTSIKSSTKSTNW